MKILKILLADDDQISREGLANLLNVKRICHSCCENGSEALRVLAKQNVDVALLDVDIPTRIS